MVANNNTFLLCIYKNGRRQKQKKKRKINLWEWRVRIAARSQRKNGRQITKQRERRKRWIEQRRDTKEAGGKWTVPMLWFESHKSQRKTQLKAPLHLSRLVVPVHTTSSEERWGGGGVGQRCGAISQWKKQTCQLLLRLRWLLCKHNTKLCWIITAPITPTTNCKTQTEGQSGGSAGVSQLKWWHSERSGYTSEGHESRWKCLPQEAIVSTQVCPLPFCFQTSSLHISIFWKLWGEGSLKKRKQRLCVWTLFCVSTTYRKKTTTHTHNEDVHNCQVFQKKAEEGKVVMPLKKELNCDTKNK